MKFELPPEIGPHEGREYQLMLAGLKKVALFEILPSDFLENKSRLDIKYLYPDEYNTIAYIKGGEFDAAKLSELIKYQQDIRCVDEATEYAIGEILDYSKHEVKCFLEHCKAIKNANERAIHSEHLANEQRGA